MRACSEPRELDAGDGGARLREQSLRTDEFGDFEPLSGLRTVTGVADARKSTEEKTLRRQRNRSSCSLRLESSSPMRVCSQAKRYYGIASKGGMGRGSPRPSLNIDLEEKRPGLNAIIANEDAQVNAKTVARDC